MELGRLLARALNEGQPGDVWSPSDYALHLPKLWDVTYHLPRPRPTIQRLAPVWDKMSVQVGDQGPIWPAKVCQA